MKLRTHPCTHTLALTRWRQRTSPPNINTKKVGGAELLKACGAILEDAGRLPDAADLFERAGLPERAAAIHIAARNFAAAAPLMAQVKSARLQLVYAKAKEAQGRWAEAAAAYEAAGDAAAAARLCLEKLGAPARAAALARAAGPGGAPEAAAAVARHCLAARDAHSAVEFLLLAGQVDQAFDVAASHGEVDAFAALVGNGGGGGAEAARVAEYYEARGQLEAAGDVWARGGDRARAAELYLRAGGAVGARRATALFEASGGDTELAGLILGLLDGAAGGEGGGRVTTAAAVAAATASAGATQGFDGEESARHELRLRLLMALGRLPEAAKSALELARRDQVWADGGRQRIL